MTIVNNDAKVMYIATYIYGIVLIILTGTLYLRLFMTLRRTVSAIRTQEDIKSSHSRRPKHLIVLTETVIFILMSLLCCYLPYITAGMTVVFESKGFETCVSPRLMFVFNLSRTMMYANCAMNALIFMCRNSAVQRYISGKLRLIQNYGDKGK